jgi:hypothetical protein
MASIEHIPKMYNEDANRLAQNAAGYRPTCDVMIMELPANDRRREIIDYLKNPSHKVYRQLKFRAAKFVLVAEPLELFRLKRTSHC